MVLKTGDRASEVSQNFGMSSRWQNFEEFIMRKTFHTGWGLGSSPATLKMGNCGGPTCAATLWTAFLEEQTK